MIRLRTFAVCVVIAFGTAGCTLSTSNGPAPTTDSLSSSHIPTPPTSGTVHTSNPPTPPTPTTGVPTKASLTSARAALAKNVRSGEDDCVVELPSGFEAVIFDNVGHLRFYKSADGQHWTQDGTSLYYYDPSDAAGQHLKVDGALLTGMAHATFILHGSFSGDGSGTAMAYTQAPIGWGPLITSGSGQARVLMVGLRQDTGTAANDVYHELSFSQGELADSECDYTKAPAAMCGAPGTLIVTHWRWDTAAQEFRVAS